MKNQEISTLIGQKRAYNSSSFLLRIGENSHNNPKNIAILASKKNFKTAVVRNKVKRLIKNALQSVLLDVSNSSKGDKSAIKKELKANLNKNMLVFSPKKGFEAIDFNDLKEEIRQICINNGII